MSAPYQAVPEGLLSVAPFINNNNLIVDFLKLVPKNSKCHYTMRHAGKKPTRNNGMVEFEMFKDTVETIGIKLSMLQRPVWSIFGNCVARTDV